MIRNFAKQTLTAALFTAIVPSLVWGQVYEEYLIHSSMTGTGGNARIRGLGGAGVSLGADPSLSTLNPAALGMLRRSEWSASVGGNLSTSGSEYLGTVSNDLYLKPVMHNFNAAFSFMKDDISEGDWRGGTFGVNVNRIADFTRQFSYSGRNTENSYLERIATNAYGINQQVFDDEFDNNDFPDVQSLAYAGYLIDPDPNDQLGYVPIFPISVTNQRETVTQSGRINSWDFSYGGNYKDKLYLGATLGILGLRFNEFKVFEETLVNDDPSKEYYSYKLTEDVRLRGTGFNLGFGVIYKVSDVVRIGGALKTPTVYAMSEKSNVTLESSFYNLPANSPIEGGTFNQRPQQYRFAMATPGRINVGATVLLKKIGFVTYDVEYLNYASGLLFNENGNELGDENKLIKQNFTGVINFRAGGELRLDIFRLRAGVNYMANPINKSSAYTANLSRLSVNFGAGVRMRDYYVDGSFSTLSSRNIYQPYNASVGTQPEAINSFSNFDLSLSFGAFF